MFEKTRLYRKVVPSGRTPSPPPPHQLSSLWGGGGGVVGTATTQQSFYGNTYYSGRCYSWFYCVLFSLTYVYLLYSPSITFEVGFYA